jgi:2-hydroxychromene-2-carboxylate isomerase
MSTLVVEFWFEFASTYSYPASQRVEDLSRLAGVSIQWRPFLLGPIFKSQGWTDSPFNLFPAKGKYMWRDVERVCESLRFPFRRPSRFPRNGLLAARLVCAVQDEPWVGELVRRIYRANFADDLDIAEPEVLRGILSSINRAPELLAEVDSSVVKEKLRAQTERAASLGIFGAPSFIVGEELFWGNDRLEASLAWAKRGQAPFPRGKGA